MADLPVPNTIYRKLADARGKFHNLELVKTGKNKFAGYSYFELGDFLIPAMNCLRNEGLVAVASFTDEEASLTLFETEGKGSIVLTSPMKDANLKGCHPIQNLGAVETYQRRYLWVALMEIVEHDALDSAEPAEPVKKPAAKVTKVTKKTAAKKEAPKQVDRNGFELEITTEEEAEKFTDVMIQTATEMHSDSKDNLISFWKKNVDVINYLSESYPNEFERLKNTFSEIKAKLMEQENE